MYKKKWTKLIALMLMLSMVVWTLSACGSDSGSGDDTQKSKDNGGYTASEVTSDLSMAESVKKFNDAIDMQYAKDLTWELAYNWEDLADFLGWRSAGSDGEHACADYLAEEWENIGLENVEKLGTPCDKFQFNGSSLKIEGSDVDFMGEDIAGGTNGPASYQVNGTDGDLTAEIVNCKTGFAADYEGKDVTGKIVLVQVDQANESWIDGYIRQAYEEGAAALVTWANSGYGEAGTNTINVQDVCCPDLIPTVAVSADQAKKIKKAIKNGHTKCTLNVDAEMVDNGGTTYNVVGMIPGENHDQRVIISAHYDKYWYGYQDDCAAVGLVAAVAKAMVDSGYYPKNDIYFIAHGAEEWGVTGSQFDWTTGAWGICEQYPEITDGCLAMLNCELPAFKPQGNMAIASVPEFKDLQATLFKSGLITTAGKAAFDTENQAVNTMEDGISYREHGVPYFVNAFEDEKFVSEKYHTAADDESTYNGSVYQTNIRWYGAFAMYIDTEPALEINLAEAAKEIKKNFNEEYAKKAGVDTETYMKAVEELQTAGKDLYDRAVECNAKYEEAVANEDNESITRAREEGAEMNKKALDAFQEIQDEFFYTSDFTADYGQLQSFNNLDLIDNVLKGLKNGDAIWGENGDGIADYAYNINLIHDYSFCIFSPDVAKAIRDMYQDSAYVDQNQGQWGYAHQNPIVDVAEASADIQTAETIEDVDVEAATEAYKEARQELLDYIGTACTEEITSMQNVTEMLK